HRSRCEGPPVRQRAVLLQRRGLAEAVVVVLTPERSGRRPGEVPRTNRRIEPNTATGAPHPVVELLVFSPPLQPLVESTDLLDGLPSPGAQVHRLHIGGIPCVVKATGP